MCVCVCLTPSPMCMSKFARNRNETSAPNQGGRAAAQCQNDFVAVSVAAARLA